MSQQRIDAAIVSMASSLAYVGVEQASRTTRADDENDNDAAVNLFVFICSLSKDNLPTGLVEEAAADSSEQNQTRGLIAKLINLFADRERSQFTPVDEKKTLPFTADHALACLFDDLEGARPVAVSFEQYCNVPFCLSALVQVMFARGALPSELILCPKVVMSQKIRLFIAILVGYALSLQLDGWEEGGAFDAAFTEYDFLVRLVASFIRKFLADGDSGSSAVTLGAFYVMASVCLVSRHPATNLDGWCCFSGTSKHDDSTDARKFAILSGFAKKYAAKAVSTLSSVSDTNNDWTLTASAMLPAVSLYQLRLSHMQQKTNASSVSDLGSLSVFVQSAVDLLASHESNSALLAISKRCFVSILSRYYDWLSLRGERLNALQIATWNRNMARSLGTTHLSQWLEATTLSQSVRETYLPRDQFGRGVQFSDQASIAVVEVQACRLRSQLLGALVVPELDRVRASLYGLLDQLHVIVPKPDPSQVDLLMPWVRSTVVSGLADAAHLFGELDAALCHYKTCLRECHLAAVALGRERRVIPGPSGISVPFWESVPVSSAILRYRDRQMDCLMRISLVHESLGDYKKATTYAICAVQRTGMESTNSTTFPEFIESIKQEPCESGRERQARRLLVGVKARATALDIVQNELGTDIVVTNSSSLDVKSLFSADQDLEGILDNLAFNSLLHGFSSDRHSRSFYDTARSKYDQLVHQPQIERLAALLPGRIASSVLYDLKLAEAKSSFSRNSVCEAGLESVVRSNCEEIIRAPAATVSCRAEAFYLLGLLDLGHARESGALAAAWQGRSNLETTTATEDSFGHALDRARTSFAAALSMLGPASNLSTRCALRSLALVSGPLGDHKVSADSSCILIHTSIGSGSRQNVAGALRIDESCGSHDRGSPSTHVSVREVFAALDTSLTSEKREVAIDAFMRHLKALTPPNWRYVACTICPTGELLVSSLSKKADDTGEMVAKTACIFPDGNEYGEFDVGSYDQIVKPLDSIIYRMDHTIKTGKNADSMEEAEKREWWNGRKTLDLELRNLIETVEEDFFSSEIIRIVIDGASSKEDEDNRSARFGSSRGNLASLFDAATHESDHEDATQPCNMNVAELKEELTMMGFEAKTLRKMRKAELVALVSQERQRCCQEHHDHSNAVSHEGVSIEQENSCTILVLDENLHRFPFEGLPILERKTVCRVPSLPFAIAKLAELSILNNNGSGGATVDGKHTSYVVDPESNLSTTKDRLVPFLESISEKHGGSWKGVAGEVPSPSFIEESLLATNGLFLYFGHGCGKPYFSRKQIESLRHGDGLRRRRIQSSVVLMGCSSGRLESVNRRNAKSIADELPIYYDPEGTALSYLSAGAPCVIGNLWDVTDVDIDRYAMQMLDQFFNNGNTQADDDDDDDDTPSTASLAECVAKARSACRMRYLVGCAPVCYGIPVYRR
jgi:separase